jgi:outer membrane protein assembly factor BamA
MYADEISSITIDKKNVQDSAYGGKFFLGNILNDLHTITKDYVIADELIFADDEELNGYDIYETERLLRTLNIFSKVSVTAKENREGNYDINVTTQDRWSLEPSLLYGSGGGAYTLGGGIREWNLFGTGTYLQMDALYRSENKIGWEGFLAVTQRRLFRLPLSMTFVLQSNSIRTDQLVVLKKPFFNYRTKDSYGIEFSRSFGDIYYYNTLSGTRRLPFNQLKGSIYWSHAWINEDKVYFTMFANYNKVNRGLDSLRQAFDNTASILASFTSVSDDYQPVEKIDTYLTQDLCVGGFGNVILGRTFKVDENGDGLYYLAAQGEKSLFASENIYLYGHVTGSSGFTGNAIAKYTYFEFSGIGFFRLSTSALIAARIRNQSVWNWAAKRQLVLDNDAGLRGYGINSLSGDNRLVANVEFRIFPDWKFWFLNISGVAFTDIGTSWNQDMKIYKSRWHQSIGIGLRIHNLKSSSANEVIRFDFAYNLTEKKSGLVISSGQLFSLVNSHNYKLPELFGREFDQY